MEGVRAAELGGLLRLLAHDLRNPLAALDSNLQFLEAELGASTEQALESLEDSKFSCDGLARIVDSVEVLGRFLEGRAAEEPMPIPVSDLAAVALDLARPMARSHRVELGAAPPVLTSGREVLVGRDMFVRALRALLHNSIQHAPKGTQVQVTLEECPEGVVLRVRDQGAPLDVQMAEEAFSAAGQLRAKRSRGGRYSGGLGLFCARICAEAAGATLRAVPDAMSTTFELIAPVA
jgi:signal transduction histidine kinase